MRGESALCCPAQAPPLGFVPSAELVFVQVLGESGCRADVFSSTFTRSQRPCREMRPRTSCTNTHAQHFASASTWGTVSITKNGLCSDLSVSEGQLNERDIFSLKTKRHK